MAIIRCALVLGEVLHDVHARQITEPVAIDFCRSPRGARRVVAPAGVNRYLELRVPAPKPSESKESILNNNRDRSHAPSLRARLH